MDKQQNLGTRLGAAERPQESGAATPGRGGRMSRQRKMAAVGRCAGQRRLVAIDPRPGQPPDAADHRQAIRLVADRRDGPAHRIQLRGESLRRKKTQEGATA
jgi:hypothetical protein